MLVDYDYSQIFGKVKGVENGIRWGENGCRPTSCALAAAPRGRDVLRAEITYQNGNDLVRRRRSAASAGWVAHGVSVEMGLLDAHDFSSSDSKTSSQECPPIPEEPAHQEPTVAHSCLPRLSIGRVLAIGMRIRRSRSRARQVVQVGVSINMAGRFATRR